MQNLSGNKEQGAGAAQKEKKAVALSSVIASMFLTIGKLVIGVATGSLGILSEAAHSALDLGAAVITYFAVSISDKPADKEHHYGHGKVENFSALIEALLLLITCFWIIGEAVQRLRLPELELNINPWAFGIMIVSIVVDFSRARALKKAAKKYNSQALEADALHFSSDILSSSVVIVGLIFARFGYEKADPIAALLVAALVIVASLRLAKKTVDGLLDRAPEGLRQRIHSDVTEVPGVLGLHKVRVRQVGPRVFGDLHVVVDGTTTVEEGHRLAEKVEEKLAVYAADIVVHIEPGNSTGETNIDYSAERFKYLVDKALLNLVGHYVEYHQLAIYQDPVKGIKGGLHLVLPRGLQLEAANDLVHYLERELQAAYPGADFHIRLEPCNGFCQNCSLDCEN